ncbi:hypothetical protein [Mycolicibacterium pallens]|nr:hypothetical protein [Mycolicibacterium pallens]
MGTDTTRTIEAGPSSLYSIRDQGVQLAEPGISTAPQNLDPLGRRYSTDPGSKVPNMTIPSAQFRSPARRPPAWQRWVLNALHNFDLHTIDDWTAVMTAHLERSGGATPMQTARYTVDTLRYAQSLRRATAILAAQGNPAARYQLADAALDLRSALDRLHEARDELLKAAGSDRVTYD